MRAMMLMLLLTLPGSASDAFGIWTMNAARSTGLPGPHPQSITLRIESHAKGEVFTMDRIEADGRITTSSTILYLDGQLRQFQDPGCEGTQSSRRVDPLTVEILRKCASGDWVRLVQRLSALRNVLVLEVTEQQAGGRRSEHRLVLQKQSEARTTGSR